MDFLETLRQKPEATRKRIVFISAFVFTGVVFFVWLSVMTVTLTDAVSVPSEELSGGVIDEYVPAFDDVQEDLRRFMEEGRSVFGQQVAPLTSEVNASLEPLDTTDVETKIIDASDTSPDRESDIEIIEIIR